MAELKIPVSVDLGNSLKNLKDVKKGVEDIGDGAKKTDDKLKNSKPDQPFVPLKKQLKEAVIEQQRLTEQFGAFSVQAKTAAAKVADLRDRIGDAKQISDSFNPETRYQNLTLAVAGAAGSMNVLIGAQTLLGNKSEALGKIFQRIGGALQLTAGLAALSQTKDAIKALGVGASASFGKMVAGIQAATGATKGLSAAIASTGIGLLLVGIGLAITAISNYASKLEEGKKKQEEFNKALGEGFTKGTVDASDEMENLSNILDKAKNKTVSNAVAIEKYNSTIGRFKGRATTIEEVQKGFNDFSQEYIDRSGRMQVADLAFQKGNEELATAQLKRWMATNNNRSQSDKTRLLQEASDLEASSYQHKAKAREIRQVWSDWGDDMSDIQKDFANDLKNLTKETGQLRKKGMDRELQVVEDGKNELLKKLEDANLSEADKEKARQTIVENAELKTNEVRKKYSDEALQQLRGFWKMRDEINNKAYLNGIKNEETRATESARLSYEQALKDADNDKKNIKYRAQLKAAIENQYQNELLQIQKDFGARRVDAIKEADDMAVQTHLNSLKDSRYKSIQEETINYQKSLDLLIENLDKGIYTQEVYEYKREQLEKSHRQNLSNINKDWDNKDLDNLKKLNDLRFEVMLGGLKKEKDKKIAELQKASQNEQDQNNRDYAAGLIDYAQYLETRNLLNKKYNQELAKINKEDWEKLQDIITTAVETTMEDMAAALGSAIGAGEDPFEALKTTFLTSLGNLATDLGKQIVVFSKLFELLSKAIAGLGFAGKLAAGLALIAFGAAVKAAASKSAKRAGFATGGFIYGPGTETSDSIPARLSRGEYVVRAKMVKRYGKDFFDRLNRGIPEPEPWRAIVNKTAMDPSRAIVNRSQAMRFATGGFIHGPGTETSDSIFAMLSRGEYVIKAKAVKKYGKDFFDKLNKGIPEPEPYKALVNRTAMDPSRALVNRSQVMKFAFGGYVDPFVDRSRALVNRFESNPLGLDSGWRAIVNRPLPDTPRVVTGNVRITEGMTGGIIAETKISGQDLKILLHRADRRYSNAT